MARRLDRMPTRADLIAQVSQKLLDFYANPEKREPYLSNRAEHIIALVASHLDDLNEQARMRWAIGDWRS